MDLYAQLERIRLDKKAVQRVINMGVSKEAKDELVKMYSLLNDETRQVNRRIDIELTKQK